MKKRFQHRFFPVKFTEFLRTPLEEHLRTTASKWAALLTQDTKTLLQLIFVYLNLDVFSSVSVMFSSIIKYTTNFYNKEKRLELVRYTSSLKFSAFSGFRLFLRRTSILVKLKWQIYFLIKVLKIKWGELTRLFIINWQASMAILLTSKPDGTIRMEMYELVQF